MPGVCLGNRKFYATLVATTLLLLPDCDETHRRVMCLPVCTYVCMYDPMFPQLLSGLTDFDDCIRR